MILSKFFFVVCLPFLEIFFLEIISHFLFLEITFFVKQFVLPFNFFFSIAIFSFSTAIFLSAHFLSVPTALV